MKNHLLLLVFFSIIFGQFSCEKGSDVKIGFLLEGFNASRWNVDKKYFEEGVKSLNAEVITKMSDGTEAKQYSQALELIDEGVDVIVIVAANVNSAAAIVREAHHANIKVIAYDRLIKNSALDYFVGMNTEEIGVSQAEYALSKKPEGNYVLIGGDKSDDNAISIMRGQNKVLKSHFESGKINLLYHVYIEGWSTLEAANEIEKVIKLTNKKIDAVVCSNDGTAMGVSNKLLELNRLDDVVITGLDADLKACRRIVRNQQSMTICQPYEKLATTAAKLAVSLAKNEKLDFEFTSRFNGRHDIPAIIHKPVVIDKSNLNKVVEDGIHSKEEIYND